jgi:hypothetical protein
MVSSAADHHFLRDAWYCLGRLIMPSTTPLRQEFGAGHGCQSMQRLKFLVTEDVAKWFCFVAKRQL